VRLPDRFHLLCPGPFKFQYHPENDLLIDWEYIGSRTIEILAEAALSSGIILGFFCCFLFLALILQLVTLSLRRRWYEILGNAAGSLWPLPELLSMKQDMRSSVLFSGTRSWK
jgi:hypothetical protein